MLILDNIITFLSSLLLPNVSSYTSAQSASIRTFYTLIIGAVAMGIFALVIKLISKIKSLAFI